MGRVSSDVFDECMAPTGGMGRHLDGETGRAIYSLAQLTKRGPGEEGGGKLKGPKQWPLASRILAGARERAQETFRAIAPDETAPRHTTVRPRAGGAELGVAPGRYDKTTRWVNDEQATRRHASTWIRGRATEPTEEGVGGHPGLSCGLWTWERRSMGHGNLWARAWAN